MAKITELPHATAFAGEETVVLVQAEETRQAQLSALIEASALLASTYLQTAMLGQRRRRIGWINPDDYVGISYRNDYGVKFFDNGMRRYTMRRDDYTTRDDWRIAGIHITCPDDGLSYVAVNMARVRDPLLQGVAATIINVHNITGNDTTGTGSLVAPYRTVEKAIAVLNADPDLAKVWDVRVRTTSFIGGNSAGWSLGTHTIAAGKKVHIHGVGATRPVLMPQVRNNFSKAMFAWQHLGGGVYKSTAGAISVGARNTNIVCDLSINDENGMPIFGEWLAGPFADDDAVVTAMAGRTSAFHTSAANALYVKLASGAEPDPGINYAYVELSGAFALALGEGSRVKISNFRIITNAGVVTQTPLFARPAVYALGPSQPNVEHDNELVFEDIESYGSSGNAFGMQSVRRWVVWNSKDGHSWLDGPNPHSLYTSTNSNSPLEGSWQHTLIWWHLSLHHGPNPYFRHKPAVNSSANAFTEHDRAWSTIGDSRGGASNGAVVAFVGGSKGLLIGVDTHDPKQVVPSAEVYSAAYLAAGHAAFAPADPTELFLIDCAGWARPYGKTFYLEGAAKIVAAEFRHDGPIRKQLAGTGTLTDGYGGNL